MYGVLPGPSGQEAQVIIEASPARRSTQAAESVTKCVTCAAQAAATLPVLAA